VIVVSQADVERLLDLDELLEALAKAHAKGVTSARGAAEAD
jgi:hypothetical protein